MYFRLAIWVVMALFVGLFGRTSAQAGVQLLEDIPFGREAVQKAIDAKAKFVLIFIDTEGTDGLISIRSRYEALLEGESVEDYFRGRLLDYVFMKNDEPLEGRFVGGANIIGLAGELPVDMQWTVYPLLALKGRVPYINLVKGKIQPSSAKMLYEELRRSTTGSLPIQVDGLGWAETLAGWYNPHEKTSSLIPFTSTVNGSTRGCGLDGVRNGFAYLPIDVLTEGFGDYMTDSIVRLYGSESKDPADMVEVIHRFRRVGGVELLPPLQPAARTIAGGNTNESPRSRLRLWVVGNPGETLALQKATSLSLDGGGWETTQNVQIDPHGTGIEYVEVPNTGTFGIFRIRPPSGGP